MSDLIQRLTQDLRQKIDGYQPSLEVRNVGTVLEAGDGIAQVDGLAGVKSQELVEFANGVLGIAFNLEENRVGVIITGDYSTVAEGMNVYTTGRIASVPVGDAMIGRVVNALGQPIDDRGPIAFTDYRPLERLAPGVVQREDVNRPVQTGLKVVDAITPIGRGQRQLIIGDRQTGKTALAIDTILNQVGKNLICIYVAVGQKKSSIARTIAILEAAGAMDHTIFVIASADEPAALQYLAPYTGCAIGEELMETGRDALVVYDDLSKHAWAYRQVSLLMRRPPGREAYPGDVFYLHSRLLERAAQKATEYVIVPKTYEPALAHQEDSVDGKVYGGPISLHNAEQALKAMPNADDYRIAKVSGSGGSLTALPIIETLLGDVSAYIPTNVISITDGQIYLESSLFNAGIRPAMNVGISVSRVGGAAQTKAMRQVAGRLRLDMAAFRDLAAFAQFGSDLDKATQQQLSRGQRLQELLKQPQYQPMSLEHQVISLFAGVNGFADSIPLDQVSDWEAGLQRYMDANHPEIPRDISERKAISDSTQEQMREAITNYNLGWK